MLGESDGDREIVGAEEGLALGAPDNEGRIETVGTEDGMCDMLGMSEGE